RDVAHRDRVAAARWGLSARLLLGLLGAVAQKLKWDWHRLTVRRVRPVGKEARDGDAASHGDEPEHGVAPAVDEVAKTAGEEHEQDDDPGTGGEERPAGRQEVLNAVDVHRAEHRA